MEIHVTQEDIDKGEPGDGESCAIACALMRQGVAAYPCVGDEVIYLDDIEIATPVACREFISQFDTDKTKCVPFSFTL